MVLTRAMDNRIETLETRIGRTEEGVQRVEASLAEVLRVIQEVRDERRSPSRSRRSREERRNRESPESVDGVRREENFGRKLELPTFSGANVYDWLNRVNRYFEVNRLNDREKLRAVMVVLEGEALHWYQWWERNTIQATWGSFHTEILSRFQPELEGNPLHELLGLRQKGTVQDYRRDFERISGTLDHVDDEVLRGIWLSGLSNCIREELLMQPLDTLPILMRKAQRIERRNWAWAAEGVGGNGLIGGGGVYKGAQSQTNPRTVIPVIFRV